MKKPLVAFLFLASCASAPQMSYKNLELPPTINEDSKRLLSNSELEADKTQLIYALNTAYSGRKYLPYEQFEALLREGPVPGKEREKGSGR